MLLDNHHGPDPRVDLETELLKAAGISTRVVAWDRRSERNGHGTQADDQLVRITVPAPSGGGWRSFLAMVRFGTRVWRRRRGFFGDAAVLVVHDVYLLPLGWALARRLRLPFFYDAHEEYRRMEATRHPQWLLWLVTAVESWFARSAVAVIVPGASRLARWEACIQRRPIILPNFVRRDQLPSNNQAVDWDIVYGGTISKERRPDLLVELARMRPDLRIGIAGRGRSVEDVARAADELPNLAYLGWISDVDALFSRTKAIYYGLDPNHPYSEVACPRTLYQALRHRKPLLFFCGGEAAQLSLEFKIGVRCSASAAALSDAIDCLGTISDWEFDAAWQAVWQRGDTQTFVGAIETAARSLGDMLA